MTVPIRFQKVPLARIDLAEAAVEMAAAPGLDRLAASLQEVGLINPPGCGPSPAAKGFTWSPGPGAFRPQPAWAGRR